MSPSRADPPPLIGVAAWLERAAWGGFLADVALIERHLLDKLRAAGAHTIVVPPDPDAAERVSGLLDGVVLAGGRDVDAACYGAPPHPRTDAPQPERDAGELALLRAVLARDLPVLAICRGCQLLNVALGGSLRQHLGDGEGARMHRVVERPEVPAEPVFARHRVTIATRDPLAAVLGERPEVASSHHQAIDRLGAGMVAIAHAPDGVVEAVRLRDRAFAVGVQWHPEVQVGFALFAELVRVSRAAARLARGRS